MKRLSYSLIIIVMTCTCTASDNNSDDYLSSNMNPRQLTEKKNIQDTTILKGNEHDWDLAKEYARKYYQHLYEGELNNCADMMSKELREDLLKNIEYLVSNYGSCIGYELKDIETTQWKFENGSKRRLVMLGFVQYENLLVKEIIQFEGLGKDLKVVGIKTIPTNTD